MAPRDDDHLRRVAQQEVHDQLADRGQRLLCEHDRHGCRRTRPKPCGGRRTHTLCFLYFLQTELGFHTLGLADDEFPTEDLLPFYPYHRESRRIHGLVRFTLNDISDPYANTLYRTTIGVGDYPIDQHHALSEWSSLPNLYFHPVPSYGVPMGVMLPAAQPGLIVAEKSISVTNLVNGSTRLQPVVLQIGQAAGALAAPGREGGLRTCGGFGPRGAGGDPRRWRLPAAVPRPALDRPALQGHAADCRNGNPARPRRAREVVEPELVRCRQERLRGAAPQGPAGGLSGCRGVFRYDGRLRSEPLGDALRGAWRDATAAVGEKAAALLEGYDAERPLTRLECAQLIDAVADPFHSFGVAIDGRFLRDDGTTAAGSK